MWVFGRVYVYVCVGVGCGCCQDIDDFSMGEDSMMDWGDGDYYDVSQSVSQQLAPSAIYPHTQGTTPLCVACRVCAGRRSLQ